MQKTNIVRNYLDFEDLKQKLGYKPRKHVQGPLGKDIAEACKNQKAGNFLKKHLDSYFSRLRHKRKEQNRRYEKQNS